MPPDIRERFGQVPCTRCPACGEAPKCNEKDYRSLVLTEHAHVFVCLPTVVQESARSDPLACPGADRLPFAKFFRRDELFAAGLGDIKKHIDESEGRNPQIFVLNRKKGA